RKRTSAQSAKLEISQKTFIAGETSRTSCAHPLRGPARLSKKSAPRANKERCKSAHIKGKSAPPGAPGKRRRVASLPLPVTFESFSPKGRGLRSIPQAGYLFSSSCKKAKCDRDSPK